MPTPIHRQSGLAMLRGHGLEIGALHEPSTVPPDCHVSYLDILTPAQARRWFPELKDVRFVDPDFVADLDQGGLDQFEAGAFDFIILSHVLEHVANPIRVVREIFRILRPGGLAVIAVPDKIYTFDRDRALTTFDHLWLEYEEGVTEVTDDHYLDFLRHVGPHVFQEPPENLPGHLQWVRSRREHAHVWDSSSFRAFLLEALRRLAIPAELRFESTAGENGQEHFSVWEKRQDPSRNPA